jgi:hypothetical protein
MFNCTSKPSDHDMELVQAAMPRCVHHMVKEGKLTDLAMDEAQVPAGLINVDDKGWKSQRCVLMCHEMIRATRLAEMTATLKERREVEKRKEARTALLERKKADRETKKAESSSKARLNKTVIAQIRDESANTALSEDDAKCLTCEAKWSIFVKHAQFNFKMHTCRHCGWGICSLCCPQRPVMERLHESMCQVYTYGKLAIQARKLQEHAYLDAAGEDNATPPSDSDSDDNQ